MLLSSLFRDIIVVFYQSFRVSGFNLFEDLLSFKVNLNYPLIELLMLLSSLFGDIIVFIKKRVLFLIMAFVCD